MMTKDKELLLKDLCARLPYNVIVRCTDSDTDYKCFLTTDILNEILHNIEYYDYKPYLRSMLSMTDEEKEEYELLIDCSDYTYFKTSDKVNDWLNKNHFDHRGLIPMGLALEAPKSMYSK